MLLQLIKILFRIHSSYLILSISQTRHTKYDSNGKSRKLLLKGIFVFRNNENYNPFSLALGTVLTYMGLCSCMKNCPFLRKYKLHFIITC